ncbi:MAG: helix-turn-helix transcriptional regulator [Pseudomonadota bacterium]|uniref:helix-turn-helix domain-containing protein n=1 Tax=Ralstonia pickettii TaxID=329 RepID=UPI0027149E77|nr:helix-turn-helix transcriptional regulator [Ralstonia pickettii]MEE2978969.1 helix-turn-helix transcriptional regulator [Pseudomonadota bacterium]WKZ87179.1 helix-turn-helix transcriptional regulator [Ralstonia pickettii]
MEQPFKQLHSLRKSRKLKQEDVAKMAGISREAYLRAESGRADPRLSTLMAVAGALGLEVVLAPREAVAEIERVIANHPAQPTQGGGGADAGHERSEHGSGTGGGHGLAGQYRGPERHPQSAYHPGASHSQAGQQGAPHAGGSAEDRSRMTSDRPGAGGSSGGSDRPGGSGSGSRES